jgi:Tol biopolymer transport system component
VAGALITATVSTGLAVAYRLAPLGRVPRVSRVTLLTQTGHADLGGGLATDGSYVYFVERAPGKWGIARVPVEGGPVQPVFPAFRYPEILDISPDRTKLLVNNGVGDDVPLWAAPADNSEPRRIGDAAGHTAAWSPDGKHIVFGRGSALFMVNVDGSGLHKLLETPGRPDHVRWAPSRPPTVLRYAVDEGNDRWQLWEAWSDGANPHLLLPNWDSRQGVTRGDDSGNWIARGKYYVFRSVRGDLHGICVMQEAGRFLGLFDRHPVLIHSAQSGIFCPTPSPDSKRVFFISGLGRRQFVRYDARRREFVPFLAGKSGRWISFSRDGRWLAFTSGPNDTLFRSRPDGSETVPLTPSSMHAYEPSWSPDGAWIAFSAHQAGQIAGAFVIPSAGGTPQRLISVTSGNPVWSPDGKSIMLRQEPPPGTSARGLYVMDWHSRSMRAVPDSSNRVRGAWSPDGQHIAATDGLRIHVFDLQTQRWIYLATANSVNTLLWSRKGKYLYYQDAFEAEQPVFRVLATGGKIERMVSSRQIPQSDLTGYLLAGLAPDDALIGSIGRNNSEIYALNLDLP